MKIQRLLLFALTFVLFTTLVRAQTCSNTFGVLFGSGNPPANQCTSSTNSLIYVDTTGTQGEFFCQCVNGTASWIQSNSPGLPPIPPTLSCTPVTLLFPATNTSQSSAVQNVTCSDTASNGASVIFSGVTLTTGTSFSQTNNCGTLTPGQSCTIGVTFTPTTTGTLVDTLNIASNASGSPATVALAGTGQTPVTPNPSSVSITPASPTINIGGTSAEAASLVRSDGTSVSVTSGAYWNSATTANATVAQTGVVTGVASGTSVISANAGTVVPGQVVECNTGSGGPFQVQACPNFPKPVQSGNTLLCDVMWGSATGTVSSVTDILGNSFSAVSGTLEQANGNSAQFWISTGIAGGTDAITNNWSAPGIGFPDAICMEIQGTTTVDQGAVGTAASATSASTTAITPAQASESIFEGAITANFIKTIPANWFCVEAGTSGLNDITGKACPVSSAGSVLAQIGLFSTSAVTPSVTTNSSSTIVINAVALKSITGSTTVTVNNSGATSFSLSNQPTTYPYIAGGSSGTAGTAGASGYPSIFDVDLQAFYGSQSSLFSHCWNNSSNCAAGDVIAQYWFMGQGGCSGNGCGLLNIQSGSATNNNGQSVPIYYAQASDPLFVMNSSTCNGTGVNVTFHAPNGANFSGANGDNHLIIYDNPDNMYIELYAFGKGAGFSVGTSTCFSGQTCNPQPIPNISACTAGRIGTDSDFDFGKTFAVTTPGNYTLGSDTNSAGIIAGASVLLQRELANNAISHVVRVSTPCVANLGAGVFPSPSGLLKCASPISKTPQAGMWFICDYTDSQINGTSLPAWQKAVIKQACHYGMVIDQTSGGTTNPFGFSYGSSGALEGQTAYFKTGTADPYMATIVNEGGWSQGSNNATNGTGSAVGLIFANMPLLTCSGAWCGTDSTGRVCSSNACDPTGHIHLLDSCVAKKLAGQAGGC